MCIGKVYRLSFKLHYTLRIWFRCGLCTYLHQCKPPSTASIYLPHRTPVNLPSRVQTVGTHIISTPVNRYKLIVIWWSALLWHFFTWRKTHIDVFEVENFKLNFNQPPLRNNNNQPLKDVESIESLSILKYPLTGLYFYFVSPTSINRCFVCICSINRKCLWIYN